LVGTAATGKVWRDVDVRLILPDDEYDQLGLGHPHQPHSNPKWISFCLAYSSLGKSITGLPIDFQIQQQTDANNRFGGSVRHALGLIGLRYAVQPDWIKELNPVDSQQLEAYELAMKEAIPEIVEAVKRRATLAEEARQRVMSINVSTDEQSGTDNA
jgi:hypothetical protein